jgi:DGQHR domain-containing protein
LEFEQAKKKIEQIHNENEREIGMFFLNLGFNLLDCNPEIKNSANVVIGEIDLLFLFCDYLIIIEVSKKKDNNEKIVSFFSKWSERANETEIFNKYKLNRRKVFRLYVSLSSSSNSLELSRLDSASNNKIMYPRDYDYFHTNYKKIGSWVRSDLLDWMRFERKKQFEEKDAIQYYIGNTTIFCLVMRVDRLLEVCTVSRKRTEDEGYQRALNGQRISEISKNIQKGDGLIFPNSILINAQEIRSKEVQIEDCPKAVKIDFPLGYATCRIIDGQHRLLGFTKLSQEEQKKFFLPVIALKAYDPIKEMRTFIEINSKQQKINNNLILYLKSRFLWVKDTNLKEYKEKIAVKVAEQLNETFFKNGIYFGWADQRIGNMISLTTIVSSMLKNGMVQEDIEATGKKIGKTFSIISRAIYFGDDSYFKTNSGIRVLFRMINLFERNVRERKIVVSEEQFFHDLNKVLDGSTDAFLRSSSGTFAGAINSTIYLIDRLKEYDQQYAKMEAHLPLLRNSGKESRKI